MSVFAESIMMVIIAVLLIIAGWVINHFAGNKYKEMSSWLTVLILSMIGIAFLLILISHIHVYTNGTEQELIRWLFWMRR